MGPDCDGCSSMGFTFTQGDAMSDKMTHDQIRTFTGWERNHADALAVLLKAVKGEPWRR